MIFIVNILVILLILRIYWFFIKRFGFVKAFIGGIFVCVILEVIGFITKT